MSAATSASTGRPYGLTRVCAAWRVPRSSFSAERARRRERSPAPALPPEAPAAAPERSAAEATTAAPRRPRGPRPQLADERVLELTRGDLAGSPFHGEGHRKVCARLRRAGHPVFARQVLRVMRGAQLLSPHRARQGHVRAHDGRIVTDAPDVMWGTDGMRVETVEGWV
jgi:putative transposase